MNIKNLKTILPYGRAHLAFITVVVAILTMYIPIFILPLIFFLYILFPVLKQFALVCALVLVVISKVLYNEYFYTNFNDGTINMNCNVLSVEEHGGYIKCSNEKIRYYLYNNDLDEGDIIYLSGEISTPKNNTSKYGFNYKRYLLSQKVNKVLTIDTYEYVGTKIGIPYIRGKILDRTNKLSERSNNYVNKILFNNNQLDEEISDGIKNIGISHIFAISGMHIVLLFNLINIIVKKFNGNLKRGVVSYPFLFFYWSLAGFSVSISRALFMLVLTDIFKYYNEKYTRLDILSIVGLILVTLNPFIIFSYSFILSMLITFALIYYDNLKLPSNKILLPIFLQIMILPFIINMNNQVNTIFIVSNIIFLPVYLFLLFPLAFIVFLFPFLDVFLKLSIALFEYLLGIFTSIDIFTHKFASLSVIDILIYYCLLLVTIHLYEEKIKYYKNMIVVTVISIFIMNSTVLVDSNGYVKFYDVGQGDSILIKEPYNRCNVVIDAYNGTSNILVKEGVHHLDYLVITHGHDDHYGDYMNMFDNIRIDNLIVPYYDYSDGIELVVEEAINNKLEVYYLKAGDSFECGKTTYEVITPYEHDSTNVNNNSLTILANINNYNFLFTGDIEEEVEYQIMNNIIDLDIDILKVAHHGSNSSSINEFIEYISPTYGVISVKENNRYNMPHTDVLTTLKDNGVYIYRTDVNGTIEYTYKKNKAYFKTYPG